MSYGDSKFNLKEVLKNIKISHHLDEDVNSKKWVCCTINAEGRDAKQFVRFLGELMEFNRMGGETGNWGPYTKEGPQGISIQYDLTDFSKFVKFLIDNKLIMLEYTEKRRVSWVKGNKLLEEFTRRAK